MKTTNKNNMLYPMMETMAKAAIQIIQNEAATFSRKIKTHYNGTDDDLVTSADYKAQDMYVEEIQKHFPGEGIIGEENDLNIKPLDNTHGYFTIDPLDGTRAFGRLQSTGSGTMIAHVQNGIVDAVCIGDINTGEVYGYGPSHLPTRTRFGVETPLAITSHLPLKDKFVLLRDHIDYLPAVIQKMVSGGRGGIFKDIDILSGSIGLNMARLWKNEVAMIVLKFDGFDTPWDNTPFVGMNQQLGIVTLRFYPEIGEAGIIEPNLPLEVRERKHVEICVHKEYATEVIRWIKNNK